MHMAEVSIAYGMTETSPVSTQTRSDDDLDRRTATVGRVHPHVEVKIVDPVTGQTVERGEPGEFCTRGYSVMIGYWEDPEKTAEAIDADGLDAHRRPRGDARGRLPQHRRPDQGHGDPRRREHLPARDRGVPLHPSRHRGRPGVGVPDERYGEELCAWIRLRAGAEPVDAAARARVLHRAGSPTTRSPATCTIVDEFPMTVTGKIRKVQMREESIGLLGLEKVAARQHA